MVMKGQVAHWSGFQEEVGSVMTGTDTAGFTMLTGSTGTGREMSPPPLRADTEDWHSWLDTYIHKLPSFAKLVHKRSTIQMSQ